MCDHASGLNACRCTSPTDLPQLPTPPTAGILSGALLLGLHMAATHGVSVAMLSSYIPAQPVPGLGRLSGTAWALTDLLLGERHCHAACACPFTWWRMDGCNHTEPSEMPARSH